MSWDLSPVDLFNAFEIGLWLVIALVVGALGWRAPDRYRRWLLLLAALLLLAFSGSDAVELHTGAWWRPWWLLCWKGACVIGLLSIVVAYWMTQREKEIQTNE